MKRVRFAARPTGSLHVGAALNAVASRRVGDWLLLRIDDSDLAGDVAGGEDAVVDDLRWLGLDWDEGPVRQSERADRHREAATLLGADGSPAHELAGVVDDVDFGITHVVRGSDHRADESLHRRLTEALGARVPEYIHHGLVLGDPGATLSQLRELGIPAEAVRAYLEELGLPREDVHYDWRRIRGLAIRAIAAMADEDLAARAGAPVELARALRSARNLVEAREMASAVGAPAPLSLSAEARPTLDRFRELRVRAGEKLTEADARAIVRELKAVGGDLRALRLALTGTERGPELWTVVAALSPEESLRRLDRSS